MVCAQRIARSMFPGGSESIETTARPALSGRIDRLPSALNPSGLLKPHPRSTPFCGFRQPAFWRGGRPDGRPPNRRRFGAKWSLFDGPYEHLGAWVTIPKERRFGPFQGIKSSAVMARMAAERLSEPR